MRRVPASVVKFERVGDDHHRLTGTPYCVRLRVAYNPETQRAWDEWAVYERNPQRIGPDFGDHDILMVRVEGGERTARRTARVIAREAAKRLHRKGTR